MTASTFPGGPTGASPTRLTAESALIIAVAVVAGVAHLHSSLIVALMAGALVIVALSEWLAARARFVPPAVAFMPAPGEGEPAPYVEVPHPQEQGWGPAELAPSEDTEPEALTVIAGADEHGIDPWEQQHDDAELEDAEPDGESVPQQPGPELAEQTPVTRAADALRDLARRLPAQGVAWRRRATEEPSLGEGSFGAHPYKRT